MFVTSMLADAAQVNMGKLYILGGNIDNIPAGFPFALVLIVDVDWDETNKRHDLIVSLVDGDGAMTFLPGPAGSQPFEFKSQFELGRPPGVPTGVQMRLPITLSIPGLQVSPGRYQFRVSVKGQRNPQWDCAFSITQLPPQ
jgi:hypothetical protein